MGIGLSGMISGLDTDTLIKQLMSAERTRVTKVDNKITKNEWTTEKWKDLNTKLYALYTGSLSKMKTQGNYLTKKTTSSNEKVATVKAGSSAPIGTHYITVDAVASSQYVTGGKFTSADKLTSKSKLSDAGVAVGTKISLTCGDKSTDFVVNEDSTFADLSEACKSVGLNMNLDESRQCLYINSRQSGTENKFSITTSLENATSRTAKQDVRSLSGYNLMSDSDKTAFDSAMAEIEKSTSSELNAVLAKAAGGETLTEDETKLKKAYDTISEKTLQKRADELAKKAVNKEVSDALKSSLENDTTVTLYGKEFTAEEIASTKENALKSAKQEFEEKTFSDVYSKVAALAGKTYSEVQELLAKDPADLTEAEQEAVDAFNDATAQAAFASALGDYTEGLGYDGAGFADTLDHAYTAYAETLASDFTETDAAKTDIAGRSATILADGTNAELLAAKNGLDTALATYADTDAFDADAGALSAIGLGNIDGSKVTADSNAAGMTVFEASDAKITLNGAEVTSSSNTITMNGLTVDVLSAAPGETIAVTVSQDTDSVYNMVKDFVKEYNELLEEMNNAYYAESARGYDPLTDEQKDAMSDSEVEKWENKIKDSLLRRDNTLGSLITAMRNSLNEAVNIDGKNYSLSSFGICTTKYSEKGKLHIYGNQDDPEGMTYDDKLRKAIEDDPDQVMEVLQTISKKLYDTMADKMKAKENTSSALTFYNDKTLSKELTSLKKEKTKEEDRLTQIEDRYYKQFASMEKALSNLSSQSNALLSMLGYGQNY